MKTFPKTIIITIMKQITTMKETLHDVMLSISWLDVSRKYFSKSSSWLYHKLNGIDGNGNAGGFTPEEAKQLQTALYDLSRRIKAAADRIG